MMMARAKDGAGTAHSPMVSVLHLSNLIYGVTMDRSDIASGLVTWPVRYVSALLRSYLILIELD